MKVRRKLLITGISGLLGNNLGWYFKDKFEVLGLYHRHRAVIDGISTEECDMTDAAQTGTIIDGFAPDVIIHCASLTNVDQCENEREIAQRVNVGATRHLVDRIQGTNPHLIYISTDSVYDGLSGNFKESDPVQPKNYYGRTKYQGELEILKAESPLVLRTNIFGWNIRPKKSLGEWVLQSLEDGNSINGFSDAYFSSIYTMELARILDLAIQKGITGVFNCGSADSCSKLAFAQKIASYFGLDPSLITPSSIDDFDFVAPRGRNMSLDTTKLQGELNYRLPTIDYSIECFYRDSQSGLPNRIRETDNAIYPIADGTIPYGRQWIDGGDIQAASQVLQSQRITQGPLVQAFENKLSIVCDAQEAVAVNSGTAGLHIACLTGGIGAGDEVITSPNTFVASANCIVYCGGKPVFADIDPTTYNISPKEVEKRIGPKTKAIIPVHFAGRSCDMEAIRQIANNAEKKYGHRIFIIEDACHALGSSYRGKAIGSCVYSDMTVTSFHPVKHITTGEGGAVFTNDGELYQRLKRFRSHGITNDPTQFKFENCAYEGSEAGLSAKLKPWYYEQNDLGFNYRITDLQCGLGLSQLSKLDGFKERRRWIVDTYNRAFESIDTLQTPCVSDNDNCNYHLYILLFNFDKIGKSRVGVMRQLRKRNIMTQVHYIPVHTQPYYRSRFKTNWGDCPVAENYYQKCLSIPLYPAMHNDDVDRVINAIIAVAQEKR